MNFKRVINTTLIFFLLLSNLFGQDNAPKPPYCEKSYDFLKHHCYECNNYSPPSKSKVVKFDFLGKANDKFYYYGVYLEDSTQIRYQFGIYEGNAKESILKPVYFFYPRYSWFDYYDFKMVKTIYGYIIHIQCVKYDAGWDEGEYIIYRDRKWERLREPYWPCAAEGILPEDYGLDFHSSEDYIKIDLKTMSIKIPVEKKEDGGFTATDGYVKFNLTVEKNRFGIIKAKYIPGKLEKDNKLYKNSILNSNCEKSIEYLKYNCFDCDDISKNTSCQVKEFKYIGDVSGKQYYYGLYQKREDDGKYYNKYFIIFEAKKNKKNLKPVHFFYPEDFIEFYDVDMTKTKYGLIIHIYVSDGNGGDDNGEYIIFREGRWDKLKIPEWDCVYEWVKPEDYWFCRGRTIDLKNMTITIPVYSHEDACCCPTKGIVKSRLTIDDAGFRVISSKYYPDLSE